MRRPRAVETEFPRRATIRIGSPLRDAPVVLACAFRYQKSPKTGETGFVDGSGSHAFYFRDPDWNRIEVYCWMMTATGPSMAAPHPDL